MEVGSAVGLVGLALIDSTSIGTLIIPIWLLLAPSRPRVRFFAAYLATIALFYFAAGAAAIVLVAAGAGRLHGLSTSRVVLAAQLAVGITLFAVSWLFDSKRRRRRGLPNRTERWRNRVITSSGSSRALVALALTAGIVEMLSMVPYLAAITLIAGSHLPAPSNLLLLAAYCLVMVTPATVLLIARTTAHSHIEPALQKIEALLARHADTALGWTLGIVGFLIARDAIARLFLAAR